jgi:predicted transcriptional regulator
MLDHRTALQMDAEVLRVLVELVRLKLPHGITRQTVLPFAAVVIGQAESRPMTAHKIAQYVGAPRTTVIRRLDNLVALGAIVRRGTRYYMTTERLHVIASNVENTARVVIDAGAKLSKMVS